MPEPFVVPPLDAERTGGQAEDAEHTTVGSSPVTGEADQEIHLPGPSALPLLLALGLLMLSAGLLLNFYIAAVGVVATGVAILAWARPALAPATEATAQPLEGGDDLNWWGLLWFLLTEAALFAYLIAAYLYIRAVIAPEGPPAGTETPHLTLAAVNTALLLLSSIPVRWAGHAAERGRRRGTVIGLALTIVMGGLFLALQGYEYATLAFSPQTNIYGSVFYTLTGFHGAHVLIGLLIMSAALWHAARGRFSAERHFGMQAAELYWHFVDVVWVILFLSLYVL
jgi:heme/copper-type cytochrome/quinol oxidase subunit 3